MLNKSKSKLFRQRNYFEIEITMIYPRSNFFPRFCVSSLKFFFVEVPSFILILNLVKVCEKFHL